MPTKKTTKKAAKKTATPKRASSKKFVCKACDTDVSKKVDKKRPYLCPVCNQGNVEEVTEE